MECGGVVELAPGASTKLGTYNTSLLLVRAARCTLARSKMQNTQYLSKAGVDLHLWRSACEKIRLQTGHVLSNIANAQTCTRAHHLLSIVKRILQR